MALSFTTPDDPTFSTDARIAEVHADPGFGRFFTDHMVLATWTEGEGWHDAAVVPYGPLPLDPAGAVLHYGQEIFEGLKAYRHADGSIWTFRPEANGARFIRSAKRLALPELPVEDFVASVAALTQLDERWVPGEGEQSLYLRPFMIASEAFLGVRPTKTATYCVIASPVGAYFSGGVKPVDIWVTRDYSRAGEGGTGAAKCGGNYASSLAAQEEAYAQGCSQVLFLDTVEKRWIEELGGMNFMVVTPDGTLVTPQLTGTILAGVTRDTILQVAGDLGLRVEERRLSFDEVVEGARSGAFTEAFACGTAAVVTPIRALKSASGEVRWGDEPGEVTMRLRDHLLDIQYGRTPDTHDWLTR
ncbi:MAG TPA: branched-chain amino acid aminotransferase, partial [Propionibacteriaceae bacterium]|nr:branched-chain amino acid aminotransferase [Propionibacteriaceae bacterium]